MLVRKRSFVTGADNVMDLPVTAERIDAWLRSGELVQRAFPDLTADQREFLLTGITPAEWDEHMGKEDDLNDC